MDSAVKRKWRSRQTLQDVYVIWQKLLIIFQTGGRRAVGCDFKHQITEIEGIRLWGWCMCVRASTCSSVSTHPAAKRGHLHHVHTFMCVWVGPIAAYSLGLPALPSWWLTAAISFLSEWVYNPCYNAVIIQYAYICLALTKHVQS